MIEKFSDKEIIAAINIVHQILDIEEFSLNIDEYGVIDETGDEIGTELMFSLIDHQGAYLGGLNEEKFDNLASVIERMNIYHNDYLYNDFEERIYANEYIPADDYDRKLIMFLESDYCTELLSNITASIYSDYVKTGYGKNEDRLKDNKGIDELSMLLDKGIAKKIIDTQSAYVMVEHHGKICVSHYNTEENKDDFLVHLDLYYDKNTEKKKSIPYDVFHNYNEYDNYKDVIISETEQIKNDMHDIGLTERGIWSFYLSKNELIYIGISEDYINNILTYEQKLDENNEIEME